MNIKEMIKANAENKKALAEMKEKVLDGERKIYTAILEAVAEKTEVDFKNGKLGTLNGVFRIGYAYADSQSLSLLYYNIKKNGEESSRWSEQIFLGGGSKAEQFISWSNKTGSTDIEDVVQYIIDNYFA